MKKYVKMRVMLFKNWKHVFKMLYQTDFKYFSTHEKRGEGIKETDSGI